MVKLNAEVIDSQSLGPQVTEVDSFPISLHYLWILAWSKHTSTRVPKLQFTTTPVFLAYLD